jgi:hypothetical protein
VVAGGIGDFRRLDAGTRFTTSACTGSLIVGATMAR